MATTHINNTNALLKATKGIDNSERAKLLNYSNIGLLVAAFIYLAIEIFYWYKFNNAYQTYGDYMFEEAGDGITALVKVENIFKWILVVFKIASVVFLLMWYHRAYKNIVRMKLNHRYETYWAVWGFIVPFVNIVMPYRVTQDLVNQYSAIELKINKVKIDTRKILVLVIVWWSLSILERITVRLLVNANSANSSLEELNDWVFLQVASQIFFFSLPILGVILFRKLTDLESKATKTYGKWLKEQQSLAKGVVEVPVMPEPEDNLPPLYTPESPDTTSSDSSSASGDGPETPPVPPAAG